MPNKTKTNIEVGQYWQLQMNRQTKGGSGRILKLTEVGDIYTATGEPTGRSIKGVKPATLVQNYLPLKSNALGQPILPAPAEVIADPKEDELMRLYDENATLRERIAEGSRKFKASSAEKEVLKVTLNAALKEIAELESAVEKVTASASELDDSKKANEQLGETCESILNINTALLEELKKSESKIESLDYDYRNMKNAHDTLRVGMNNKIAEINELRADLRTGFWKRLGWSIMGYHGASGQA